MDLSTDYELQRCFRQVGHGQQRPMYDKEVRLQLPRIIYALSNLKLNIRACKGAFRDAVADPWLVASLWRRFGAAVCVAMEASPSRLTALVHTYGLFGGALEKWHQPDFPDYTYLGLEQ